MFLPPFTMENMTKKFYFKSEDLKQYPHFDAPISLRNIEKLVTSPYRVAKNSFYPLFLFYKNWQPFRKKGPERPPKKERPIRYSARKDSYIFSYYRYILSNFYEKRLQEMGIDSCPIAYRKIKKIDGAGKCNIDFAKDAFDAIDNLGDCVAICLDIEKYFESLDHDRIYTIWCDLLSCSRLPDDHYAVFKNITAYSYVDQKSVYVRLGYWGVLDPAKPLVEGIIKEIPAQICSTKDFRAKICGRDPKFGPSLIEKNVEKYGIPQGTPISDLIANFYLLYFDKIIYDYISLKKGKYFRYSDDILIILPKENICIEELINFVSSEIEKTGEKIKIKKSKTSITEFFHDGEKISHRPIPYKGTVNNKNGLEYLGFRYDGENVYIRDSTVSRFYRKVSSGAKQSAHQLIENNPSKTIPELIEQFNFSIFYQRYGKVDKEKYIDSDYKSWTFYTYMKRACQIFDDKGLRIAKQFSNFKKFSRKKVLNAIEIEWNKKNF